MLWGVQMNRRHKASLICILGLGTFATAAAFVKLSYLPAYGREGDLLWDSRNMTIWTVIECNVGIIAGNLPCLKPLFRTIWRGWQSVHVDDDRRQNQASSRDERKFIWKQLSSRRKRQHRKHYEAEQ